MRNPKAGLAIPAAALLAGLLLLVRFASPYQERVAPLPEIEAIWAIEDARTPSETPLCQTLLYGGVPLPMDGETGTWYCPIGLRDAWPELELYLPQGAGLRACFADDVLWDDVGEAVASATPYRILFYTDERYAYQDIVFTGLPILSLTLEGPLEGAEDTGAEAIWAAGSGVLRTWARVHRRGALTFYAQGDKIALRLEYTRHPGGKKIGRRTPGLGEVHSLALLPLLHDETMLRDRLSWTLWNEVAAGDGAFAPRRLMTFELFMDGDYRGVYVALEPFDVTQELTRAGSMHPLTDGVYRTTAANFWHGDKALLSHPRRANAGYELYHSPGLRDPFGPLSGYLSLVTQEDDARFVEDFLAWVDVPGAMRYDLMMQAMGETDNFFNNMYIWADCQGGLQAPVYRFIPWDLDMSWGLKREDIGEEYENWLTFPVFDRALNLDAGGLRGQVVAAWGELTRSVLSYAHVEQVVTDLAEELNRSGAPRREAERYEESLGVIDPQELLDFYARRLDVMGEAIAQIEETQGDVPFLKKAGYVYKGVSIFAPDAQRQDDEAGEI